MSSAPGSTKCSPATAKERAAPTPTDISNFYGWALDNDLIERDPTRKLTRPREPHYQPRPASLADVRAAIGAARQPIRMWLVLAAFEGLRACEIADLRRADVLDTNDPPLVSIREGKGGRPRLVPLSRFVLTELLAYGLPTQGRLWSTPNGHEWWPQNVSSTINRYLRSIGLNITGHQFRHFFGTASYQACRDIVTVQELMGHHDVKTTRLYIEWSPTNGSRVVEQLGETLRQSLVGIA